MLPENLLEIC